MRAKAATTIIVASPAMALILAATIPAVVSSWGSALALVVAGYTALVETVMIGTYFSSRFPDFTTTPRARFIRPLGMFLTMITAAAGSCSNRDAAIRIRSPKARMAPNTSSHTNNNRHRSGYKHGSI
ncbi:MAG: hypothetical protein NXY59_03000 [Aigarchaeota archaeon]|nr:hypothetical protein [Candidatus Pelearchaeum maunauluense]